MTLSLKENKLYARNAKEYKESNESRCAEMQLDIHALKLGFLQRALCIYCTHLAVCALKS